MNHWLVKQEPDSYPWEAFVRDGRAIWDGVRNFQARNNLRAMRRGDEVFFYASGEDKCVQGIARVEREAFPDPSATPADGDWSAVELIPIAVLAGSVSLATIKSSPVFNDLLLVRNSRLSVSPVSDAHFARIEKLGGGRRKLGKSSAP